MTYSKIQPPPLCLKLCNSEIFLTKLRLQIPSIGKSHLQLNTTYLGRWLLSNRNSLTHFVLKILDSTPHRCHATDQASSVSGHGQDCCTHSIHSHFNHLWKHTGQFFKGRQQQDCSWLETQDNVMHSHKHTERDQVTTLSYLQALLWAQLKKQNSKHPLPNCRYSPQKLTL